MSNGTNYTPLFGQEDYQHSYESDKTAKFLRPLAAKATGAVNKAVSNARVGNPQIMALEQGARGAAKAGKRGINQTVNLYNKGMTHPYTHSARTYMMDPLNQQGMAETIGDIAMKFSSHTQPGQVKLSQEKIAQEYYNLGLQLALGDAGMEKSAGINLGALRRAMSGGDISLEALRRALSGGARQSAAIQGALTERGLGQLGTVQGGLAGMLSAAQLAETPALQALLGAGGLAAGGAAGNILGRNVGHYAGRGLGYVSGMRPLKQLGNFVADPLRRVPGIRG